MLFEYKAGDLCSPRVSILREWRLCLTHLPKPLSVAEPGNDGVDGIEDGIERDTFIYIQPRADGIDHEPHEPLLHPLARQHPHGHDGERRVERVPPGHSAVREMYQHVGNTEVDGQEGQTEQRPGLQRSVGDGPLSSFHGRDIVPRPLLYGKSRGRCSAPDPEAVDGYEEIVDVYAEVGIEPGIPIDEEGDSGHHHAGYPHAPVGLVLPVEVQEADQQAKDFEHAIHQNFNVTLPIIVKPAMGT